jgi:hypothetical protein
MRCYESAVSVTFPLEGEVAEGAGRGVTHVIFLDPPPQPSPSRGEGAFLRSRLAS